jgi:hypothetical protein
MAQFKAMDNAAEVNGQTILSVVKGMPGYESTAISILASKGLKDINDKAWYSQQAWLDAFKEIAEKIGVNTLRSIGTKIIESAQWPPSVTDIETALNSIDVAYHMNHSLKGKVLFDTSTGKMSEGIGHYFCEKISNNEFRVTCENPYPCDFDKGLLKGVVEKFKKPGQKVEFMENVKSGCRNTGSHKCTYHVLVK